jgi:hypothetical protein
VVAGWAIIAIGVVGLAGEGDAVPVSAFTRWVVGLAVFHDLVFAPLVAVVGVVSVRLLPARIRPVVTSFAVVAGMTTLFAWPFVERWGISPSNPSIQPRNYARGLTEVLAVVATVYVVSAVTAVVIRRAGRRRRRESPQDGAHV